MADIIQLLPDSVANQIAAGEVIQRPASIIKELVENSIDAAATEIKIVVKDGGRSLVQVIDNGQGMSATDARMAFERHATSKIRKAEDLFGILSMGFRGEALASIAAVAQVELKTRREEDTLGSLLVISGSQVQANESTTCPVGSNFQVKNLFFNVPARRKFLKKDSTEFKHIITVFQRIALTYPQISFTLIHNDKETYVLPKSDLLQRIINMQGRHLAKSLNPLNTQTSMISISGYIGKPEHARKSGAEQFFFVNNRFMKHPYFHKAVMLAYQELIPANVYPSYFIYLNIDPNDIDINIHPTKTEINFENSQAIFQIIRASVKESLGKYNVTPSIDFNQDGAVEIPYNFGKTELPQPPEIHLQQGYNPFDTNTFEKKVGSYRPQKNENPIDAWEKLYEAVDNHQVEQAQQQEQQELEAFQEADKNTQRAIFQLKKRYIVTPVKSGLMIIDQKRAHQRVLYDYFSQKFFAEQQIYSQQTLFPVSLDFNQAEQAVFEQIAPRLQELGFDIAQLAQRSYVVNGAPADVETHQIKPIIEELVAAYEETETFDELQIQRKLINSLAKASSIDYGRELNQTEMQDLLDNLLACPTPNFTETGKKVIHIIDSEDIQHFFD